MAAGSETLPPMGRPTGFPVTTDLRLSRTRIWSMAVHAQTQYKRHDTVFCEMHDSQEIKQQEARETLL